MKELFDASELDSKTSSINEDYNNEKNNLTFIRKCIYNKDGVWPCKNYCNFITESQREELNIGEFINDVHINSLGSVFYIDTPTDSFATDAKNFFLDMYPINSW